MLVALHYIHWLSMISTKTASLCNTVTTDSLSHQSDQSSLAKVRLTWPSIWFEGNNQGRRVFCSRRKKITGWQFWHKIVGLTKMKFKTFTIEISLIYFFPNLETRKNRTSISVRFFKTDFAREWRNNEMIHLWVFHRFYDFYLLRLRGGGAFLCPNL